MPSIDKLFAAHLGDAANSVELRVYDIGYGIPVPVDTPAIRVEAVVPPVLGQDNAGEFLYIGTNEGLLPYIIKRSGGLVAACPGLIRQNYVGGMAGWSDTGVSRLYVSGTTLGELVHIYGYEVDQASGGLVAIPGSPWPATMDFGWPGSVAIESAGSFLYTAYMAGLNHAGRISAFRIQPNGSLTRIAIYSGDYAVSDWTRPFLYVTNNLRIPSPGRPCEHGCGLHVFRIDSTGELQEISGSPFRRGETIVRPISVTVYGSAPPE